MFYSQLYVSVFKSSVSFELEKRAMVLYRTFGVQTLHSIKEMFARYTSNILFRICNNFVPRGAAD